MYTDKGVRQLDIFIIIFCLWKDGIAIEQNEALKYKKDHWKGEGRWV